MTVYIVISLALVSLLGLVDFGVTVLQARRRRLPGPDPVVADLTAPLSQSTLALEHELIFEGAITDEISVRIHRGECQHCKAHGQRRDAVVGAAAVLEQPGELGAYRETPAKVDGWVTHHGLGRCHKLAGSCPLCRAGVPFDLLAAGAWLAEKHGHQAPQNKLERVRAKRELGMFGALLEAKREAQLDRYGSARTSYEAVMQYARTRGLVVTHRSGLGPGALVVGLSDGSEFIPEDGAGVSLNPRSMGIFRQAPSGTVRVTGPERPCGVMHHGDCEVWIEARGGVRTQTWACTDDPYEGPDLW